MIQFPLKNIHVGYKGGKKVPDFITENLTMVKGDTKSFGFELSDDQSGSITLNTAYFSCKKNYEDADYVFQKSLNNGITSVGNNQFVVRVAPEDTQLLDPGQYYYDLQIGVNSDIYTIVRGILEIVPEVTEPNAIVYTSVNWGNINGTLSNQSDLQTALNNKANTEALAQVATTGSYEDLSDTPSFATVATSGLYNDLIGKPTIPTITQILNLVYPVGSYYWSSDSTNPATIFGFGNWTQITDRFIYAAGSKSVGDTGGEETHTLTVNEMPQHRHEAGPSNYWVFGGPSGLIARDNGLQTAMDEIFTGYTGGSAAHNNMPPYLVAYCFRRTS